MYAKTYTHISWLVRIPEIDIAMRRYTWHMDRLATFNARKTDTFQILKKINIKSFFLY